MAIPTYDALKNALMKAGAGPKPEEICKRIDEYVAATGQPDPRYALLGQQGVASAVATDDWSLWQMQMRQQQQASDTDYKRQMMGMQNVIGPGLLKTFLTPEQELEYMQKQAEQEKQKAEAQRKAYEAADPNNCAATTMPLQALKDLWRTKNADKPWTLRVVRKTQAEDDRMWETAFKRLLMNNAFEMFTDEYNREWFRLREDEEQ